MTTTITILLVDDHKVVRQGVRAFLDLQPDLSVVAEAENGEEAVMQAQEHAVEATRQVKQVSPRSQVIVLTSYHQDEHIFPAIRAGALSYLLKDVEPLALADAVRKAAEGEAVLHPRVAARVVQEIHGSRKDEFNPFTELSERELDVLKLIADGQSNNDIAESLFISPKTVKSHVSNILGKLHLGDRTQAAVYAWREGVVRRNQ
jgi:NarL family two-component system response regulator LiaR